MYLNGYGVEKDIQKAVIWLKKATLNGSASSAYTLAKLYENGEGIEKNIEEAYSYYQISAVLGNFYANYQVGKISLQKGEIEKLLRIFKKQQKEIYLTLGLNSVKYIQTKVTDYMIFQKLSYATVML